MISIIPYIEDVPLVNLDILHYNHNDFYIAFKFLKFHNDSNINIFKTEFHQQCVFNNKILKLVLMNLAMIISIIKLIYIFSFTVKNINPLRFWTAWEDRDSIINIYLFNTIPRN